MADPGRFDAIVLGAGPNGLAAALRLARSRLRVVVIERRATVGGLAGAREIEPGWQAPGVLHDDGRLEPRVVARLRLERHGLELRPLPPVLLAAPGDRGLLLARDPAQCHDAIAARSPRDADAYVAYREFCDALAPLFRRALSSAPPPLDPRGVGERLELAGLGFALWRLGRRLATELVRTAPMCAADFLNARFETPLLVEGLAAPAVTATWAGPWSAGTATNLLLYECAPGLAVAGGPAGLVAALAAAARAAGVEIRTGAEAVRIDVDAGRVAGVELAGGERIEAPLAIATCHPARALLGLLPPGSLPLGVEREVANARSRGSAAKLHLALEGPAPFTGPGGEPVERVRLGGGHVDELERAFDALKHGRFSERPTLDVQVPSLADPSLAPSGGHVVSVLASFVPRDVEGGWTAARRVELAERILGRLEEHAAGLRSRVVAWELLTPVDLENEYALPGGQLDHVEPALDQLLVMRPGPTLARYATPVRGLWLGGGGSHGGGLTATAGLLAAERALATR